MHEIVQLQPAAALAAVQGLAGEDRGGSGQLLWWLCLPPKGRSRRGGRGESRRLVRRHGPAVVLAAPALASCRPAANLLYKVAAASPVEAAWKARRNKRRAARRLRASTALPDFFDARVTPELYDRTTSKAAFRAGGLIEVQCYDPNDFEFAVAVFEIRDVSKHRTGLHAEAELLACSADGCLSGPPADRQWWHADPLLQGSV